MQPDASATQRMNRYEWVIRNLEFLSPNLPHNLLVWTQDIIFKGDIDDHSRESLTTAKHTSDV